MKNSMSPICTFLSHFIWLLLVSRKTFVPSRFRMIWCYFSKIGMIWCYFSTQTQGKFQRSLCISYLLFRYPNLVINYLLQTSKWKIYHVVVKTSNKNLVQEGHEWSVPTKTGTSDTWLQLVIILFFKLKYSWIGKNLLTGKF